MELRSVACWNNYFSKTAPRYAWGVDGSGWSNVRPAGLDEQTVQRLEFVARQMTELAVSDAEAAPPAHVAQQGPISLEQAIQIAQRQYQGRVVRAHPVSRPDYVMTRVVEGGSGYLTQSQYELHFATIYPEPHRVTVHYADGPISLTVSPGERVEVTPDGFPFTAFVRR